MTHDGCTAKMLFSLFLLEFLDIWTENKTKIIRKAFVFDGYALQTVKN